MAENNSFGDGSIQFLWQFGLLGCDLVFLYWVMTALRCTMVSRREGWGVLRNTVVWATAVAGLQGVCTDCMMVASGRTSAEPIFTQVQDV